MDGIVTTLKANWVVIAQAPWAFVIVTAVITATLWIVINFFKAVQFEALEARLKLRDDEIGDYKRKLAGASPDEAKARMEALEKAINALQPKQRSLSDTQKHLICKDLARLEYKEGLLAIIYVQMSLESASYARDFQEALAVVGWNVVPDVLIFGPRITKKGLTLSGSPSAEHQPVLTALTLGFQAAGLEFALETQEDLTEVRIYVDMMP